MYIEDIRISYIYSSQPLRKFTDVTFILQMEAPFMYFQKRVVYIFWIKKVEVKKLELNYNIIKLVLPPLVGYGNILYFD